MHARRYASHAASRTGPRYLSPSLPCSFRIRTPGHTAPGAADARRHRALVRRAASRSATGHLHLLSAAGRLQLRHRTLNFPRWDPVFQSAEWTSSGPKGSARATARGHGARLHQGGPGGHRVGSPTLLRVCPANACAPDRSARNDPAGDGGEWDAAAVQLPGRSTDLPDAARCPSGCERSCRCWPVGPLYLHREADQLSRIARSLGMSLSSWRLPMLMSSGSRSLRTP
jgi:hypothetical protein